ncbi:tail fiber domain-containing protein [Hyalangium versicolor]|uniref:tail fiber domain-containing protein n=1 Tax=Hyalangium versicolor TaxID=2861190 RepID=UPI001CCF2800|nr:tail fiber domain-containing protein [Hyalangium versicolor]
MTLDDSSPLFDYFIATQQAPLQASTSDTPTTGLLTIYVKRKGSEPAYTNEISIYVRADSEAGALFQSAPSSAINTGDWGPATTRLVRGSEVGLSSGSWAHYTFSARDPKYYDVPGNLVFCLSGPVSTFTGSSEVHIYETSGTTDDPSTFTDKELTTTVDVVAPAFYLKNLIATATGAPTVPRTEFDNGAEIQLSWESNGTYFEVYRKGDSKPVYQGSETFCPLPGLATDTTLFLVASMTGDPGQDEPSGGYQAISLYDALTITIRNPDLTPKTVKTTQDVTVGGALSVTGPATLDQGLLVKLPDGGGQLRFSNKPENPCVIATSSSDEKRPAQRLSLMGPYQQDKNSSQLPQIHLDANETTLSGAVTIAGKATLNGAVAIKAPVASPLYVTGNINDTKTGIEFRHTNESQGIGFTFNTIYATGSNADQDLILKPRGTAAVTVQGPLSVQGALGVHGPLGVTGILTSDQLSLGQMDPKNGKYVYVSKGLHVKGELLFWWDADKCWKQIQNRANDYAGSYTWTEDTQFKAQVRAVDHALDKVKKLQGVYYQVNEAGLQHVTRDVEESVSAGPEATAEENERVWGAERKRRRDALAGDRIGMVAQDVERTLPEIIRTDEGGRKTVDYGHLTAVLVEALKEQQALIEELRSRLTALEASAGPAAR